MKKEAQIEVIYVPEDEYNAEDFKPPASFFILNALGEGVYFKTRSRSKAQVECDLIYGVGKYSVRIEMKAGVR